MRLDFENFISNWNSGNFCSIHLYWIRRFSSFVENNFYWRKQICWTYQFKNGFFSLQREMYHFCYDFLWQPTVLLPAQKAEVTPLVKPNTAHTHWLQIHKFIYFEYALHFEIGWNIWNMLGSLLVFFPKFIQRLQMCTIIYIQEYTYMHHTFNNLEAIMFCCHLLEFAPNITARDLAIKLKASKCGI